MPDQEGGGLASVHTVNNLFILWHIKNIYIAKIIKILRGHLHLFIGYLLHGHPLDLREPYFTRPVSIYDPGQTPRPWQYS